MGNKSKSRNQLQIYLLFTLHQSANARLVGIVCFFFRYVSWSRFLPSPSPSFYGSELFSEIGNYSDWTQKCFQFLSTTKIRNIFTVQSEYFHFRKIVPDRKKVSKIDPAFHDNEN